MAVIATKSSTTPETPWHFERVSEVHGVTTETSVLDGGYETLALLLVDIKQRFPGEEIRGIGADEPEAEGLTW